MKLPTKKQILFRIISVIAIIELMIMLSFSIITYPIEPFVRSFIDVFTLVLLCSPIIYYWIIRPYVNAHEQSQLQIQHMACHDPLTNLANRRLLLEFLEKKLSNFKRYNLYGAILYIDLDEFKIINDQNGHDVGDAILIEVAQRLQKFVRKDDIVSRLGGDEFVVVLGQLDTDKQEANKKALEVAKKISQQLAVKIMVADQSYSIGASIGVRLLSPQETIVEIALKDADSAMYCAKLNNKGGVIVSAD